MLVAFGKTSDHSVKTLRRQRSVSSEVISGSSQGSVSTACQRASRPYRPRAAARSRSVASGVFGIVVLRGMQGVVGAEVVRPYDDVA